MSPPAIRRGEGASLAHGRSGLPPSSVDRYGAPVSTPRSAHEVDLTDLDRFINGFPHDVFADLRRDTPVFWHEPTDHTPDGEGFWSVTSYAGAVGVLQDPKTFSSHTGGERGGGGTVLRDLPGAGKSLNMMDDPRHLQVRRLVGPRFRPEQIARLELDLRAWTRTLLDRIAEKRECEFVSEVAAEVPIRGISLVLGVPEEHGYRLAGLISSSLDFSNRQAFEATDEMAARMAEFDAVGDALVAERRSRPGDDLLSVIARLDVPGGAPLDGQEVALLFSLLFGAGTESTRNSTGMGLLGLIHQPEQYELLSRDPACLDAAVEEIVRWTSPSAYSRRTATRDTTFFDQRIRAGQKVVLWTASANRDETVFADPMSLDVTRTPNPHLAFGAGIHHCIGAHLTRLELKIVFEELARRFERFELAGEPEWIRNNRNIGLGRLPVRFLARPVSG